MRGHEWPIAAVIYVIWALPLLLTLTWLMPPWMVSDEPFHMLRAVHVAHLLPVGQRFGWTTSGGLSDPAIYDAFVPLARIAFHVDTRLTAGALAVSNAVMWHSTAAPAMFANTVQYPPFCYVPDAVGYWIGKAAGLGINRTLLVARACNAVVFTALAGLAIGVARATRPLLLVLLALPMSLTLAASASQDGLLIATTALVVAFIDRLSAGAAPPSATVLWFLSFALAAIAMARPPYLVLLFLLLLLGPIDRRLIAAVAAGAAMVAAWAGVVAVAVMVPIGPSNPAGQWHELAADPTRVPRILYDTVIAYGATYWSEMIGRLAWNDTPLPAFYRGLVTATLAAAAASVAPAQGRRPVLVGACVAGAALLVMGLQYFDWTPVGAGRVEGVVGRYFIPLMLALSLSVPGMARGLAARRMVANGMMIVLAWVTPVVMVQHITQRFYLR